MTACIYILVYLFLPLLTFIFFSFFPSFLLLDIQRLAKTPHVLPNSVPEIRLEAKLHTAHASSSAQLLEGSCKIDQLKI